MDLTPLYELRACLRASIIAGAALAAEDFRLRRAMDSFAPFEKAAPVFAKLGQLCRSVLDPACPDRAGDLLDAITLADAVLCTQAAVNVPGEVEPLEITSCGSVFSNAPYSVLAPLLEALTTSGGGKYSFVTETHDQRPELFDDYRVRDALVKALGAGYGELAEKAREWLSAMGEPVLPMLMDGFDPRGKRDMVRRVQTIEAIAGAKANDFYLQNIPEAEKDVRGALVFALRLDEGNAEKLIELFRTEKGPARRMAGFALARMDCPAANEFWLSSEKMKKQALSYAALATSSAVSRIVAEDIGKCLEPFEADQNAHLGKEELEQLQDCLGLLPGKHGPEICEIYRRMAALGPVMDNKPNPLPSKNKPKAQFKAVDTGALMPFSEVAAELLRWTLLYEPAPDLLDLAEELQNTVSAGYAAAGLTAVLLRCSSEEAYERSKYLLRLPPKLMGRPKAEIVSKAFTRLWWSPEQGHYFQFSVSDPAVGRIIAVRQPIAPLDRRWYTALLSMHTEDRTGLWMTKFFPLDDPALRERFGAHFYQSCLKAKTIYAYDLAYLHRLGWKKCEGLAVKYAKQVQNNTGRVGLWQLQEFLQALPGDKAAKQAEAREVCRLAENGTIVLLGTGGVMGSIEMLKAFVEKITDAPVMTTDQFM